MVPQNCHPDRSAAQWRDLLFLFRSHADTEGRTLQQKELVTVGCKQAVLLDINPIGPFPRFRARKPAIVVQGIMGGEFLLKERPRGQLSVTKTTREQPAANHHHPWSVLLKLLPELLARVADDLLLGRS